MKKKSASLSAYFNPRISVALVLISAGIFLALLGSGLFAAAEEQQTPPEPQESGGVQFGQSYHNDVSPALRDLAPLWPPASKEIEEEAIREANLNPKIPMPLHVDEPDPVVEYGILGHLAPNAMPGTIRNMDGIPFPGVGCNCAPPDTNGAVGLTQYVQVVNMGYQVFNKATGASVLGPLAITSIWAGFGGVCQTNGRGDPVALYDRLANRWLISQFAGSPPTDECIAISTTSDATGTYNRYAFHLGSNFFDYPHLGVWPDGYYMAMNVFNSGGTAFLGPQAFAFNRVNMLIGGAATFVTPGITGGSSEPSFLPSDLDGFILPTAGVGNPFVSHPSAGAYKVRLFKPDFVTPANTTFNLVGSPAAAGFTQLSSTVPQLGTTSRLDGLGDRLMFRLAYRKFADGHEAVVGNYSVSAGGVAGIRWFELRAVTTAPTVFQQSTYQPDTTWRWMGSTGMDNNGNLALGFSASSATINPQLRYAGRLAGDPLNSLAQGEATLHAGAGSQTGNGGRWGDYSALTIDPVDDCTFWFTSEYMATTGNSWKTRIGSFMFPTCVAGPTPTPTPSPTPTPTPTPSPTPTPTPAPTASPTPTPTPTAAPILVANVALPIATIGTGVTDFVQPVITSAINPADNLIGFQGDFTFDSAIVSFTTPQVSATGLTASNWNVSSNILNTGPGTIKTLRVSAFSLDFTPLSGSGTLFNLNMTRVSSTPGAVSPLIWKPDPDNFYFIDVDLNLFPPGSTPAGSITIQQGTVDISGTVIYCSNPALPPVPGVTMSLTGPSPAPSSTPTDGSGAYSLLGLTSGASYTVTPTKATLVPGTSGINTSDAVAIQRHFLGLGTPLTGCRLAAADTNDPPNGIGTTDAIAAQRFFLGLTSGIAQAGKYKFTPASISYTPLNTTETAQDYNVVILGDCATGFVAPRPAGGPLPDAAIDNEVAPTVAAVALPEVAADQSKSNFIAAVTTTAIDGNNNLVGFQGDFTFDERAIKFESEPVQKAGLTAGNWNVAGNVLPGRGPMRTLRVSAYSNDFTPLSGTGTLFDLRVTQVNKAAENTQLLWAAGADQFIFIDADLKTQKPGGNR